MKIHEKNLIGDQTPGGALRLSLAALAISTVFGATPALSEPLFQQSIMPTPDISRWTDNYVEIGAGAVKTNAANGKSFKFGEFTGLQDDDPFAIVGFNWIFNSRENDALYLRTNASNLGLESRKFSLEGGKQGSWDLSFGADRLLRSELDSARFVHTGLGSSNLTNPATLPISFNAPASYRNFDVEQGRDIFRIGLRGILSANWDYSVTFREDQRDGSRLTGLAYNAGARNGVIIPYEIDDKTQQVEATLAYASKSVEGQLAYSYSRYENNLDRFRVANVNNTTDAPPTHPVAQISLLPDNEYHQINLTGAYNFSRDTRAKAFVSYGMALQDETFLPYNSAGVFPTTKSLDGKMINTVADIALTTRPVEKMNLKLGYQYRDVDNKTPRNTYVYASRDGAVPATPVAPGNASQRTNAPVSTTEQRILVDGDYEIAARTQLRGQLEHTITDYTLSDRTQTKTNKAALDLRRTFSDVFMGNIGYAFTQKTGSDYDKNVYFRETYTAAGFTTNQAAGSLTNHPSMRSIIYNDFDENRVRASGNWTATETITASASVDGYDKKYKGKNCGHPVDQNVLPAIYSGAATTGLADLPDTCLGTRAALGGNINLDIQWQPEENLMAFAFLTFAQTKTDIDGRSWGRNTSTANLLSNNWYGELTYTDQTVGVGTKWQLTPKWELGAQYAFSNGVGETDIRLATTAAAEMPDLESQLHNINLFAKWAYSSKVTFRLNYLYEHLTTKDWSYDNLTPTSNAGLLLTGQTSANYENHVIAVSVALSTW